jgi:hypothetical protein
MKKNQDALSRSEMTLKSQMYSAAASMSPNTLFSYNSRTHCRALLSYLDVLILAIWQYGDSLVLLDRFARSTP